MEVAAFHGAKVALFLGRQLCTILRDNIHTIPYPNMWDLPGGGRECRETPFECVRRETAEELGLDLPQSAILSQRAFGCGAQTQWFFIARLPADHADTVVFGDEGQRWTLMAAAEFLAHRRAIPHLQHRLHLGLSALPRYKESLL